MFGQGLISRLLVAVAVYSGTQAGSQTPPVATFKAETQMVVIAVVARDKKGKLVEGLTQQDFDLLDDAVPQGPASFRRVNTNDSSISGSVPLIGGSSACNRGWLPPFYYELSYYPSKAIRHRGFHKVSVSTNRKGLSLSYRRSYFASQGENDADSSKPDAQRPDATLAHVTCDRALPAHVLSLRVRAQAPLNPPQQVFSAAVEGGLISLSHTKDSNAHLALDVAACAFDNEGTPVRYYEKRIEQNLAAEQLQNLRQNGLQHLFEFPLPPGVNSIHFAVRDVAGDRLGTYDLSYNPDAPAFRVPAKASPGAGSFNYFGSTTASPDFFCGEVYPIRQNHLGGLLGLLYTPYLDTPDETAAQGLPGVANQIDFFFIDYYGHLWIDDPVGDYNFKVISDDGAIVYIDGQEVINNEGIHGAQEAKGHIFFDRGEHHIHVAYYQNNPTRVALQLYMEAPGEKSKILDLRNYSYPGLVRQQFDYPDLIEDTQAANTEPYCSKLAHNLAYPESLASACQYVLSVFKTMPNVICDQRTERYRTIGIKNGSQTTKLQDVVTAQVSYLRGHSTYSEVGINGKPSANSPQQSGPWADGEFGPTLGVIFSPQNAPSFSFAGETSLRGVPALLYEFKIEKWDNISWRLDIPVSAYVLGTADLRTRYYPAIKGKLWLNKTNNQIMRTEIEADDLADLPVQKVAGVIDYDDVHLPDGSSAVLPISSESESCYTLNRGCSRSATRYAECHKFAAKSRIVAGGEETPPRE